MKRTHAFFCRFDNLSLVNGNKTAGFDFIVSTEALQALINLSVSTETQAIIDLEAKARIRRAGLLPSRSISRVGIIFWESTLVPRVFHCDAVFGGSICADPETYDRLHRRKNSVDLIGDEVCYSPHNVDTTKSALALMVMAQTWSEYASAHLNFAAS